MLSPSHSVRIRLDGHVTTDEVAARLAPYVRVWQEAVPAQADEPMAVARQVAETKRALADSPHPGVRAVLLRYVGGTADLVLVARQDRFAPSALRQLARAAADASVTPPDRGATAGTRDQGGAGLAVPATAPAWGLGSAILGQEPTTWNHRLGDAVRSRRSAPGTDAHTDTAAWTAALALVLARYGEGSRPVVGLAGDTVRNVALDLETGEGRLRDLTAAAAQAWESLDDASTPSSRAAAPTGIIFTGASAPGLDYIPVLTPPWPLTISVDAGGNLGVTFREGDVSPAVAVQFARHLEVAYLHVCEAPDAVAATTDFFDRTERRRIADLGSTPTPVQEPGDTCIPAVFAQRVADAPDRIAVSDDTRRLTYQELEDRAELFARALRAHGVRPGDRVGVSLPRSVDLVATLLAVLKVNAVYVPVDPAYPEDRAAFVAKDAAWRVAVADRKDFPADVTVGVADLVEQGALIPPEANAEEEATTEDAATPAYIIYTSGSTGRPKGVEVPHSNVTGLVRATEEEYGLDADQVWTFFHSCAFDFSVWEIWGCLLTGGHLVVVPYWVSRVPEDFLALLEREGVTVLSQTPSAFTQLIAAVARRPASLSVRLVVLGGEALDVRGLLPWFDRYPETCCRLVNMFGITETTVHVTAGTVTRGHVLKGSRSVGRALPGWRVYVLDEHGRQAPPGVPGEIYVGGTGVALGYVGRDELTSQRFLPDPFTGERMYRSGDLGRLRPDGTIDHLGRIDSQVKIRGFRIELDEIRSVLLEDPAVTAAAVVVRQQDSQDPTTARIDAYFVADDARPEVSPGEVRRRATRLLPEYMTPSTFTSVDVLPLTANGKLDASRLPEPTTGAHQRAAAAAPADAPGDQELVARMSETWALVLGQEVTPDANFFELGGNSLLAVRLSSLMRERGLPEMPLRLLYLHPTVRTLAEALRGRAGRG